LNDILKGYWAVGRYFLVLGSIGIGQYPYL